MWPSYIPLWENSEKCPAEPCYSRINIILKIASLSSIVNFLPRFDLSAACMWSCTCIHGCCRTPFLPLNSWHQQSCIGSHRCSWAVFDMTCLTHKSIQTGRYHRYWPYALNSASVERHGPHGSGNAAPGTEQVASIYSRKVSNSVAVIKKVLASKGRLLHIPHHWRTK